MTPEAGTPQPSTPKELVGQVDVPSGNMLLIDFGTLELWSGEAEPILQEGDAPDEVLKIANASQDLSVTGSDAAALSSRFDLAAGRGTYFFDVPADGANDLMRRMTDVARSEGLRAEVGAMPRRMPHAERTRRLLALHPEGIEVPYHGIWAVALSGVPVDKALSVFGQRMDARGPDADRWWSVWVECSTAQIARSSRIGHVLVDAGRLMWADLASLSAFRIRARPDDLIDILFWGKDAEAVAKATAAPAVEEAGQAMFGWLNCPDQEARAHYERIAAQKDRDKLLFAIDVRPHTDEWALMATARSSATSSGSLRLTDGSVCGFFTGWGDGAYPVYREVDSAGELVRVRVELGAPEIVALRRKLDELWFGESAKLTTVSAQVFERDPQGESRSVGKSENKRRRRLPRLWKGRRA